MVSGIQNALTRVENIWRLNFGTSLIQAADCAARSNSEGAQVCKITQHCGHTTPLNDPPRPLLENDSSGNPNVIHSKLNGSGERDSRPSEKSLESEERREDTKHNTPLLGCPFQKESEVHDRGNSCSFRGAPNMWSLTQHLKTRAHPETRSCLTLCRKCWEYTMDPTRYQTFHHLGHCRRTSQPRNLRVAEHWRSLYRTVCPASERIPSPCEIS